MKKIRIRIFKIINGIIPKSLNNGKLFHQVYAETVPYHNKSWRVKSYTVTPLFINKKSEIRILKELNDEVKNNELIQHVRA